MEMTVEREKMAREVARYDNKEAISITGTRVLMRELLDALDAERAKVRKYEAGFDGIVAYRLRVCDDDSVRTLEEYGEVIDRLYHTFDADPKTGVRQ
jgi:hypothetical protein